jgi:endonuclease YncB( thermonuclease family)
MLNKYKYKFLVIILLILFFIFGIFLGKNLNYKFNQNFGNLNQQNQVKNLKSQNEKLNSNQEFNPKIKNPQINSIYYAQVLRVIDGDTIELTNGLRIRYIGINSPESGEPFFSEAKKKNEDLVLGKLVKLQFDIQTQDRYARFLAYVWADDVFVNKKLVEEGLAVLETIPPNVSYQNEFLSAQKEAQKNCKGIWSNLCFPKKEASCIKILKIFADALGDDNKNKNGEWIEIKNSCENDINLDSWLLKDNSASNKYVFKNFTLKSGKTVKIYSGCGIDSATELFWQCPEGKYAIWNNSGDSAFLYDNLGNLVDKYNY